MGLLFNQTTTVIFSHITGIRKAPWGRYIIVYDRHGDVLYRNKLLYSKVLHYAAIHIRYTTMTDHALCPRSLSRTIDDVEALNQCNEMIDSLNTMFSFF